MIEGEEVVEKQEPEEAGGQRKGKDTLGSQEEGRQQEKEAEGESQKVTPLRLKDLAIFPHAKAEIEARDPVAHPEKQSEEDHEGLGLVEGQKEKERGDPKSRHHPEAIPGRRANPRRGVHSTLRLG